MRWLALLYWFAVLCFFCGVLKEWVVASLCERWGVER